MCVCEETMSGETSDGLGADGVVNERLVFCRAECLN